MAFKFLAALVSISTIMALFFPSFGQITTSSCTSSMITTFTPCVNFVTNSTLNSTTPPSACCSSLASLMGSSKDCFCQIVAGNAPFQIPINQTLAISLPRACNMPGVPLQCKALGAPAPAPAPTPGSLANGPTLPPDVAPSPSTKVPAGAEPQSPSSAPEPETTTTATPPSPPTTGGSPAVNTGSRAGVTPSAANPSFSASPHLLLVAVLGAIAFKYY